MIVLVLLACNMLLFTFFYLLLMLVVFIGLRKNQRFPGIEFLYLISGAALIVAMASLFLMLAGSTSADAISGIDTDQMMSIFGVSFVIWGISGIGGGVYLIERGKPLNRV